MEIRYPKEEGYKRGGISPNVIYTKKLKDDAYKLMEKREFEDIVDKMRSEMWFPNKDITNIEINREEGYISGVKIVKYYNPSFSYDNLIIYFHGGGYYGGSTNTVENFCKYLMQETKSTVISVDYSLAPEYKYPKSLNEGFNLVSYFEHTFKNIYLAGDSAGGGLAASLLIKTIKEDLNIIKGLIMFYPVLLIELKDNKREDFNWDINKYEIDDSLEYSSLAKSESSGLKYAMPFIKNLYLEKEEDGSNPYISPINVDNETLKKFPKTLIFTAEYDYLRLEADYFYNRLKENNIDSKCIRYAGQTHAFIDKIGHCDEVLDAVKEIKENM